MSRPFALGDALPVAGAPVERSPFRAQLEGDTLEIAIYEDIVDSWTAGYGFGVSSAHVREALKAASAAKRIRLRINSIGGDAVEGSAIYQLLADHPAPVDVVVDGYACSAAFTIAMCGDTISVAAGGMMMLHDGWTICRGNADELRHAADMADKISSAMAKIYAARSGKTEDEVRTLMKATTWLTAHDAVAAGFATSVLPAKALAVSARATRSFAAYGFKNVPEQVSAMFGASLARPAITPTVSASAKDLASMPEASPLTRPLTAADREVMKAMGLSEDAYRANLAVDAESQTAVAGAQRSVPRHEPAQHEPSATNASLIAALGGSSLEDALGKLHSLQQRAATGVQLSRQVLDTQANDLIRCAMAGEGEKFKRPCLTPAAEHTAREFYEQFGMAALEKFLAAMPPLAITGEYPRAAAARGSDPVDSVAYDPSRPLSAQDREVMKALGIDEAAYRRNLQHDAEMRRGAV